MKKTSSKSVLRISLMVAFLLIVSASMMFIFGGNNCSIEARLSNMNVTTINTTVRGARTVTNGNALVITGSGRVEGNITVMDGALLVVEGNPSPTTGNGDRAIQGRVILNGGDFYMLSGGLWNSTAGFTLAPTVTINNGGNFTMRDGVIRGSGSTNSSTFGVDVVNGHFIMEGGLVLSSGMSPPAPSVRLNASGNGTFTMYGGTLQLPGAATSTTTAVSINGGTFYMNGGYILRNPSAVSTGIGVWVRGDGNNTATFIMNGGEINNCDTGVEMFGQNAEFIMNGGTIRDNSSTHGAGVHLSDRATFTMYDGVITNNRTTHATGSGGGVHVSNTGTTFTMYGGTISHNRSDFATSRSNQGGGVAVVLGGRFYMYGGYIENNIAGSGGGVHVSSSSTVTIFGTVNHNSYMKLDGGTIRNNEATYGNIDHGGGGVAVYASSNPAGGSVATFNMYSGYITGNRASSGNGGMGSFSVSGGGVSVGVNALTTISVASHPRAIFNMHGGTISDNLAYCGRTNSFARDLHNVHVMGGGVAVTRHGSTFNMYGGIIENNSSVAGGGVSLFNAAHFNMYDGTIRGNEAYGGYKRRDTFYPEIFVDSGLELRGGGGVYLHNGSTVINQNNSPTFNMHGGSIVENISPDGGGVYWMCTTLRSTIDGMYNFLNPPTGWDFRGDQVREFPLARVNISADAVIQYNIARNGARVDDALWGRHRAEDPIVDWGGYVVTRTFSSTDGMFNHLFNNHDIKTRTGVAPGPEPTPEPTRYYPVRFYAGDGGVFECGNNPVVFHIAYGQHIPGYIVPIPDPYWTHEFIGWEYENGDPVLGLIEGRLVIGEMIFIARFEPVWYNVTFRSGDMGHFYGGEVIVTIPVMRGHTLTSNDIPDIVHINENFAFHSWFPWQPEGTMILMDGHVFAAQYVPGRMIRFYAEPGGYLSFYYSYVYHGDTLYYDQIPTAHADYGYEFIGWYHDPYGYEVTDDMSFVAQFAPIENDETCYYYGNGYGY